MTAAGSLLSRAERFVERHERALSILAVLWFVVTAADNVGFIELPELPFFGGTFWLIVGVVWNAAWWGLVRPALVRRRAVRGASVEQDSATPL